MRREVASEASAPMIGFVAAVLSTVLAAVVLFPLNPAPRGALMIPAAVLSLGVCIVPIMRGLQRSDTIANAENFVSIGFVFWLLLDLLQGAYELGETTPEALRGALIAIGASSACMWIGVAGREWQPPQWLRSLTMRPLDDRTISRLVPICFALGMLNFLYSCNFDIPLMFSYLGADRWSAPWARGQLGGWGSFIDQMPYFGYVLPSLTALLITRRGVFARETVVAAICSVIMLLFLSQGGGRRLIGVTVGAAVLVWIQAHPRLSPRDILIIGTTAVVLAFVSQFMLNIRAGGIEVFRERGSNYDYYHVDDNFLRLAQVIELVPSQHAYVGFSQIYFTLIRPIPRVLWPNKPINPGFDLAEAVRMKGLSLSTTIMGEWYLSYGWIGVMLGGWFHGRLSKAANVLREQGRIVGNPIVYAMAVMVLVSGMRSMLDLVIMSYALVAWWMINRWMSRHTSTIPA